MKKVVIFMTSVVFIALLFKVILSILPINILNLGQIKTPTDKEYYKAIKRSAEQGNEDTKFALDNMLHNYEPAKAALFKQTKKAAEAGDAESQNKLAAMYCNGKGTEQDYAKAVYWYEKAAEQGNEYAYNALITMYCNGFLIEENREKAVYWYKKALERGFDWIGYAHHELDDDIERNREESAMAGKTAMKEMPADTKNKILKKLNKRGVK